jgi:hypothetical protein
MSTFGAGNTSLKQVATAAVLSSEETLESFPQTLDEASAKLGIRQGELSDNASDNSLDDLAIDLVHQAIHYSLSLMFDELVDHVVHLAIENAVIDLFCSSIASSIIDKAIHNSSLKTAANVFDKDESNKIPSFPSKPLVEEKKRVRSRNLGPFVDIPMENDESFPSPRKVIQNEPSFSEVAVEGFEILFQEWEKILGPRETTFRSPPSISEELKKCLDDSIADLLFDALKEALDVLFEKHILYDHPNRPYYERQMLKPPSISRTSLLYQCKKSMLQWASYELQYGANSDNVLKEVVRKEGANYCNTRDDEVVVKSMIPMMLQSILDETVRETVQTVIDVTIAEAVSLQVRETPLVTKAPPIPVRVYTDQQLGLWPRKESSMSGYTSRH